MIDYPTSLENAPAVLFSDLTSKHFTPTTLRAANHLYLYACGMVYPYGHVPASVLAAHVQAAHAEAAHAEAPVPLSHAELCDQLQRLEALSDAEGAGTGQGSRAAMAAGFNWQQLVTTLLPIILQIVEGLA